MTWTNNSEEYVKGSSSGRAVERSGGRVVGSKMRLETGPYVVA